MNDLLDLYQDIILEHNRRPRHKGIPDNSNLRAEGYNPLCGDEVSVGLRTEDGIIREIGFAGQGCAISTASASLMTEAMLGKSIGEAQQHLREVLGLLNGERDVPPVEEALAQWGDLAALQGVRKFPARIKCATLAWHALEEALEAQPGALSG